MQPLIGKKNKYDLNILELMALWNKQTCLKYFRSDPKTKIFKRTYQLLNTIVTKGFSSTSVSKDWIRNNSIHPEFIKFPLTLKLIESAILYAGQVVQIQKHRKLKNLSMADFVCHELDHSSYLLLLLNSEIQEDIYDRLYKEVLKYEIDQRNAGINFWKRNGTEKDVEEYEKENPIDIFEQRALNIINDLVMDGYRAINLISGNYEYVEWTNDQLNELYQIIYDCYTKIDITLYKDPKIVLSEIVKNYFQCIVYLANASPPDSYFKTAYLKVGGKGTWQTFLQLENKNRTHFIKMKGNN
jgi:hypothetical protein